MIDLFALPDFTTGGLAIALRPRGGDWLQDELRGLRTAGYSVLVSALETEEARELDLIDEEKVATTCGLEYISNPIPDRGLPEMVAAMRVAQTLADAIAAGKSVAVHCRQGIGRSSLTVATVLVMRGSTAAGAWSSISAARRRPVPDTAEQRGWFDAFAARLHG